MAHNVRLRLRVALVRSGVLGDSGSIELFRELATQPRDAPLCLLRKLLLLHAVVDRLYGLAHAELEVLEQSGELLFQLAHLRLPLLQTLRLEALPLACDLALTLLQRCAFAIHGGQICMQPVEEMRDVLGLVGELATRGGDDRGVEPNALRDIDAGGGAWHAETQRVGRRQRLLIEADRG